MTTKKRSELTDEELWEQCALVQGWELVTSDIPSPFALIDRPYWNNFNNPKEGCYQDEWEPTANTVEGRSQCWELMVKFGLDVTNNNWKDDPDFMVTKNLLMDDMILVENTRLQRAICEAAVMSVKGEFVEVNE